MRNKFSSLVLIVVAVLTLTFLNGCFGNSANQDLVRRLLAGQGTGTQTNWTPAGYGDYIVFTSDRTDTPLTGKNKEQILSSRAVGSFSQAAYPSREPGDTMQIWRMKKDGTEQVQLTDTEDNCSPCFTSDGHILFTSFRDGNAEVYIMNFDGSNQTRITNAPNFDGYPIACPDNRNILFESGVWGRRNIYTMDYQGQNITNLTNQESSDNVVASINSLGNVIVFSSNRNGDVQIFLMGTDGSNQTCITPHEESYVDQAAYFSPDGTKLVFYSDRGGNNEIYIMNADGSDQTQLTDNGADNWSCRFLPDGRIIFGSNVNGDYQIFVMNQDGTGLTPLTTQEEANSYPWW